MNTDTNKNEITAIISCVSFWHPGHGPLRTLREIPDDVGYNRQKVGGTVADFQAAVAAVEALRDTCRGGEKSSCTAVLKCFRAALGRAERASNR